MVMMTRRQLLGTTAAALAAQPLLRADVPDHLWQGYDFGRGPQVTDRLNQGPFPVDCALACVKDGGKYVFVTNGKVYNIENQDLALLQEHAGHRVRLTGEMKGDTITVSQIVIAGKEKS